MAQNEKAKTALLEGKIVKTMISLSLPAVIGMVVIGLYNFMDAMFVGQMLGPKAMTAVKVSYPFTFMNNGIATLIGVGSASAVSIAIGKGDKETLSKIMGNLISAVSIFSIIITALGFIFNRQFLVLCGAKGEIMELGIKYLRIVFIGSIFVNFAQSANMVMRGEGILTQAMLIMAIGAVMNIILDPVLIHFMKPYGKGIEAAALATLISQVVQAVITLWFFIKKSSIKIGKIRPDKKLMKAVLGVGVSAMLMQVMSMIQQTLMYRVAQKYGSSEWQTVLGASLSLMAFSFIPLWGISQGFQPAIGTNFGAKNIGRVKAFTKAFMIFATIFALVFYIPTMCFPKKMLSIFITDEKITDMGFPMLRLLFSTYITYGIMILSITFFQAVKDASKAAILTLCRSLILFVPLLFILPALGLGVKGLFLASVITDLLILAASVLLVIGALKKIQKEVQSTETE